MRRRILIPLVALGAMLLVTTGVVAGVFLGSDSGDERAASEDNNSTPVASPASSSAKGYLGLTVSFSGAASGLRVATIDAGGNAAQAGIRVGDIIRSVDSSVVRTPEQLRVAVEAKKPGDAVAITYERNDRELRTEVRLSDVPVNAQVESTPRVEDTQPNSTRGRLGVSIQQITPQLQQRLNLRRDSGVLVNNVEPNSPAARAGIQNGDIILVVGTTLVGTVEELQRTVLEAPSDRPIDIQVQRGAQEMAVIAVLAPQSDLGGLGEILSPELRQRLQAMIDEGTLPPNQLQQTLRLYLARGDNVKVGTVKSVNPGFVNETFILTMTPYAGGSDTSVELNARTAIRRGRETLQPAGLQKDELVLVTSMDGGHTAFMVLALGMP